MAAGPPTSCAGQARARPTYPSSAPRTDPRQVLWQRYLEMRQRGELVEEQQKGARDSELAALRAENDRLAESGTE
jgi:hypothetical protein